MTSKGLGEMSEGDSALQTCVPENFHFRWGAEQRVSRVQNRERKPPLALAEIKILKIFDGRTILYNFVQFCTILYNFVQFVQFVQFCTICVQFCTSAHKFFSVTKILTAFD
jgi:hypothetical protein